MPELNFVLPHWLYWAGLIVFPLAAMIIFRRAIPATKNIVSLPLAYFLLLTGGFLGVHRLYLKSTWTLIFIVLFGAVLMVNIEVRQARNAQSSADNVINLTNLKIERAEKGVEKGRRKAEEKLAKAQQQLADAQPALLKARENTDYWDNISNALGIIILLLLMTDAILLPRLVRQRNALETPPPDTGFQCPAVEVEHDDTSEPFTLNKITARINGLTGEFVAYWSVIAVFVYYYEVMARYVFNSPTNWAHESMFLMFGMQYLLAGGFVLREGGHVRVDVIYNYLSKRWKAFSDVLTSIFFFIFMIALLVTGWIFFKDAYDVGEVSFTEWAIQYWPIKFALPLGAALLILQGISQLIKDIAILVNPDIAELDTDVRPEG